MKLWMIVGTLAALGLKTSLAWAQAPQGTVYMKNGGRVSGELMEVLPGERVSVKMADGRTKVIDWSVVDHVDDKPVTAPVAPPAAASPVTAPTPSTQGTGDATLVFRSTEPGVVVSEVTGRAFASGYGYGTTVTASSIAWRDLCEAPCTYQLKSGFYELRMAGVGPVVTHNFTLKPGKNYVLGRPGNSAMRLSGIMLIGLGLGAAVVGGALCLVGSISEYSSGMVAPGAGVAVGGLVAMGAGIPLFVVGASHLEPDPTPAPMAQAMPRAPMLRWTQAF